eukprot:3603037-Rhodomonas_salina.1
MDAACAGNAHAWRQCQGEKGVNGGTGTLYRGTDNIERGMCTINGCTGTIYIGTVTIHRGRPEGRSRRRSGRQDTSRLVAPYAMLGPYAMPVQSPHAMSVQSPHACQYRVSLVAPYAMPHRPFYCPGTAIRARQYYANYGDMRRRSAAVSTSIAMQIRVGDSSQT